MTNLALPLPLPLPYARRQLADTVVVGLGFGSQVLATVSDVARHAADMLDSAAESLEEHTKDPVSSTAYVETTYPSDPADPTDLTEPTDLINDLDYDDGDVYDDDDDEPVGSLGGDLGWPDETPSVGETGLAGVTGVTGVVSGPTGDTDISPSGPDYPFDEENGAPGPTAGPPVTS